MEHYTAQQVEAGDERKSDPREVNEPIIEDNQDIKKDETMDTEVEKFVVGTPGKMSVQEDDVMSEDLTEGPNNKSECRKHTQVRAPPA